MSLVGRHLLYIGPASTLGADYAVRHDFINKLSNKVFSIKDYSGEELEIQIGDGSVCVLREECILLPKYAIGGRLVVYTGAALKNNAGYHIHYNSPFLIGIRSFIIGQKIVAEWNEKLINFGEDVENEFD